VKIFYCILKLVASEILCIDTIEILSHFGMFLYLFKNLNFKTISVNDILFLCV
jgi:hypothetical protein